MEQRGPSPPGSPTARTFGPGRGLQPLPRARARPSAPRSPSLLGGGGHAQRDGEGSKWTLSALRRQTPVL